MHALAHNPILVDAVVAALSPRGGGVYVDATAGRGGHTVATLDACAPDGRVIAADRDPEAVAAVTERCAAYGTRCTVVRSDFDGLPAQLAALGVTTVDGILADLGVSSPQLDDPARGFSLQRSGPLDMRMGLEGPTALDLIRDLSEQALADIFFRYGDIRASYRLARAAKEEAALDRLNTTRDLAELCERVLGRGRSHHPATLPFQALRIAVNDELGQLERLLDAIPALLAPGGVAAVLTFHSLEDRMVKARFRALSTPPAIPRGLPVRGDETRAPFSMPRDRAPSPEEQTANPRARSARLRTLIREPAP